MKISRHAASLLLVTAIGAACDNSFVAESIESPPGAKVPGASTAPSAVKPEEAGGVEKSTQALSLPGLPDTCTLYKVGFFNPLWAVQYPVAVAALQAAANSGQFRTKDECKDKFSNVNDIGLILGGAVPSSLINCLCGEVDYRKAPPPPQPPPPPPSDVCASFPGCDKYTSDWNTLVSVGRCTDTSGFLYTFEGNFCVLYPPPPPP